jgi:Protein of unknown function (DUF3551)
MKKLLTTLAVLTVTLTAPLLSNRSAMAVEYPYCRYGGGTNCGFSSFEQCIAGGLMGDVCTQNPFYTVPRSSSAPRRGRRTF